MLVVTSQAKTIHPFSTIDDLWKFLSENADAMGQYLRLLQNFNSINEINGQEKQMTGALVNFRGDIFRNYCAYGLEKQGWDLTLKNIPFRRLIPYRMESVLFSFRDLTSGQIVNSMASLLGRDPNGDLNLILCRSRPGKNLSIAQARVAEHIAAGGYIEILGQDLKPKFTKVTSHDSWKKIAIDNIYPTVLTLD